MTDDVKDLSEQETRERIRQAAEHESALLTDKQRLIYGREARRVAEGFQEYCKDDLAAAVVSSTFSRILTGTLNMPVANVASRLDYSIGVYTLAAGHLAGVYQLPEAPEGEEKGAVSGLLDKILNSQPDVPAPGQYL